MSFEQLPPELFSLILDFVTLSIDPDDLSTQLSSYSLVSRSFVSARSLLWKNLTIRNGAHLKGVLNCLEESKKEVGIRRDELGEMMRGLTIKFQASILGKKLLIPNEDIIELENMISKSDFIRLISLIPNLQSLDLYLPTFITFSPQDSYLSLLSSVTSLLLTTPTYDPTQSLLRQLLLLPSLTSLSLSSQAPIPTSIEPLSYCPFLTSLTIWSSYWERVLFDLGNTPFIPLESCSKLREIQISAIGGGPFRTLPDMIEASAEALEKFDFDGTTTSDQLLPTFSKLKNLIELNIWIRSQPLELLWLIPINIKILNSVVNLDHLIYLNNFPRNGLRLSHLTLSAPGREMIKKAFLLIPIEVKSLHLLSAVRLEDLLNLFEEEWEVSNSLTNEERNLEEGLEKLSFVLVRNSRLEAEGHEMKFRNLKELQVHVGEGEVEKFRDRFKLWGINLTRG